MGLPGREPRCRAGIVPLETQADEGARRALVPGSRCDASHMPILLASATRAGSSAEIAGAIAETLASRRFRVEVMPSWRMQAWTAPAP